MTFEIIVARLDAEGVKNMELPFATDNLNEVSQWLPAGAYTTFRTYEGNKVLWLDKHYHRLEETLALAGILCSLIGHISARACAKCFSLPK